VEKISPMHKAMNGIESFHLHSPTQLIKHFSVPLDTKIWMIHGRKDKTVPVSSTRLFYEQASANGADYIQFQENEMDHKSVIFDLMKPTPFLDQLVGYFEK
jgi:hypothetical protein